MEGLFTHVTDRDLELMADNAIASVQIGALNLIRREQESRMQDKATAMSLMKMVNNDSES